MLAKAAAATTASVHPGFFDPFLMGLLAKKKSRFSRTFCICTNKKYGDNNVDLKQRKSADFSHLSPDIYIHSLVK